MDGTAKGGAVLAIESDLKIPTKLIGMGEGIDDLYAFEPAWFARALFGPGPADRASSSRLLLERTARRPGCRR